MNNLEIERKWIVNTEALKDSKNMGISVVSDSFDLFQGYVETVNHLTVIRYRVNETQKRAYHTMKSFISSGKNQEIEFEIPYPDGKAAITYCDRILKKTRSIIYYQDQKFEVDEMTVGDKSITIAELELPSLNARVQIPSWCKKEVTSDRGYSNYNLATHIKK